MCKILVKAQKCNDGETFAKKSLLKVLGGLKGSKLSQLGHFISYRPFNGDYFSSADLEMGVRARLREVENAEF